MEKSVEYLVKANLLPDSRTREYVEAISRNMALMDVFSIMQHCLFISHTQKGRMLLANMKIANNIIV